ncbi:tyrosine-type recombinase/integrase [Amycolatopsis tolypomycina]|uniref:tyrosine-type recombinase/integrase n=1 Tax=Amycolatopsis tolypomycina TaxID=208445 RepID=UPI001ABF125F|nr:tyrosine-type recombinase/integrase [Amycolatopsis tolypomycina]
MGASASCRRQLPRRPRHSRREQPRLVHPRVREPAGRTHDPATIRLHDLRHGAASLPLAAGNDLKSVQDMLGHASMSFTADYYISLYPAPATRPPRRSAPPCSPHRPAVRTGPGSRSTADA